MDLQRNHTSMTSNLLYGGSSGSGVARDGETNFMKASEAWQAFWRIDSLLACNQPIQPVADEHKWLTELFREKLVDLLVVSKTGGGKSLAFTLPPLVFFRERTIVVQPLRALINQTMDDLRRLEGVKAQLYQRDTRLDKEAQVIVALADHAASLDFANQLRTLQPTRIIIDEAHSFLEDGFRKYIPGVVALGHICCQIVLLTGSLPPIASTSALGPQGMLPVTFFWWGGNEPSKNQSLSQGKAHQAHQSATPSPASHVKIFPSDFPFSIPFWLSALSPPLPTICLLIYNLPTSLLLCLLLFSTTSNLSNSQFELQLGLLLKKHQKPATPQLLKVGSPSSQLPDILPITPTYKLTPPNSSPSDFKHPSPTVLTIHPPINPSFSPNSPCLSNSASSPHLTYIFHLSFLFFYTLIAFNTTLTLSSQPQSISSTLRAQSLTPVHQNINPPPTS
ncbi:hypothetical protein PGT21_026461 [Puccinia graminis f. sp. tritici]|uniref:Helicase ATP-binding domain-containing protein n=1 Tax=Puccinia graminis f. sp. tritici TaxID=56615 RepID=A0A5B0N1P8_PUCGR|nr:hypothetical protein PGT21_026461 [Puccinia graminis f. sp. tritici]